MLDMLMRNWWALALRGGAAILFGLLAIFWPGGTLRVLVLFFAAYLLADGLFSLIAGLRAQGGRGRSSFIATGGVFNLVLGAILFAWPGLAVLAIVYLAAIWAILAGLALLAAAFGLGAPWGGLLGLSGLISLVWGALVLVRPFAGEVTFAWWIGAYALFFGIVMLVFALRLRRRLYYAA